MPFQDVDEVAEEQQPRTPSGVEKVLRKIFVEDWSLKLLSLAITLVLWLVVTGQNEPVTTHVSVQLNFVRPQALEISNDPPKTVDVTLTGSRSKLDDLTALDLVATIDLTDQKSGEHLIRFADKALLSLPHGVKVDGFLPSSAPIRLESIIERELKVDPKFEGKPAEGYEVYSVIPSQPTITVRGPASHVNMLDNAPTETIWLSGQKESFKASNVAVNVPDPKVDLVDPAVDVQVDIGERRIEKSFPGIAVSGPTGNTVEPETATVILLGPAHLVESLKHEDIKINLNDDFVPQLTVPAGLKGKVSLKSINPTKFILAR
jgi:YbbR domain-containing protein